MSREEIYQTALTMDSAAQAKLKAFLSVLLNEFETDTEQTADGPAKTKRKQDDEVQ